MNNVVRVALIDDHELIRKSLRTLLKEHNIDVVLEASNGEELVEKLDSPKKVDLPDVFVVDLNMPVMDGVETVKWLNLKYPGCKIVILTMYNSPDMVIKLVRLGVFSYLLKNASPAEFIKAILDAKEGKYYFPSDITSIILSSANLSPQHSIDTTRPVLTEKENDLIELICTEMTYSEIAKKLGISPRTVDTYRDNLFQKLNVKSRAGLIMVAVKQKLITFNN